MHRRGVGSSRVGRVLTACPPISISRAPAERCENSRPAAAAVRRRPAVERMSRRALDGWIRRVNGALRLSTAGLVGAAGSIHLYLYFDYFHKVPTIGTLFVANAVVGLAIATALLASDRPLVTAGAALYAASTLAAFVASVAFGLFGFHESLQGGWQELAGLVETAALVLAAVMLIARFKTSVSVTDA
jgi:hypothetical protein